MLCGQHAEGVAAAQGQAGLVERIVTTSDSYIENDVKNNNVLQAQIILQISNE